MKIYVKAIFVKVFVTSRETLYVPFASPKSSKFEAENSIPLRSIERETHKRILSVKESLSFITNPCRSVLKALK
jgi:hypothetical protein